MLELIKPLPAPIGSSQPRSLRQHFDAKLVTIVAALRPQLGFHTRRCELKKMIGIGRILSSLSRLSKPSEKSFLSLFSWMNRSISAITEDPRLNDFLVYMEKLKNYERVGVPKDAGTDSVDGFDLGRMRRLLQRLGNPQSHFKAVHIVGTKGKGSTAAFLSNILREEGYHIGCYTSPHLLTIRERICLGRNGHPVSVEALGNLFCDVRGILDLSIETEGGALSYFEVLTALAFVLFSQQNVDVAVIEAGLGGARDATNVISSTGLAAAVITSIGEEHLAALGGSLESIALAKSGIIKRGCPVVIGGPFEPHIEHIIRKRAFSLNAPVVSALDAGSWSSISCFGRDGEVPYQHCKIYIKYQEDLSVFLDLPEVKLQMLGEHQLRNAISAICTALCLRDQGWRLSEKSIQTGLEKTCLPGRGQYLTKREVERIGLYGVSILVDGAHTEASAKGLIDIMKIEHPDGVWAFVVSMASDKDHMAFARKLLSGLRPEAVILTESTIAGGKSRTTSAEALKEVWLMAAKPLDIDATDMGSFDQWKNDELPIVSSQGLTSNRQVLMVACQNKHVQDSIQLADKLLQARAVEKPRFIVVTGSLHIVSSVLAAVQH